MRDATVDDELVPGNARISADCATLCAATVVDRKPDTSVLGYSYVTVKTVTLGKTVALICIHARTIAVAERIAALTSGRSDDRLRAVIDRLTLISLIRKWISESRHQWIWTRT